MSVSNCEICNKEIYFRRVCCSNCSYDLSSFRKSYDNMIQRCYKEKTKSYKYYGAKGIKVSDEWLKYKNFKKDMLMSFITHKNNYPSTTIERIDPYKGYSKENCTWATKEEQARNRRDTKNFLSMYNGCIICNKKINFGQKYCSKKCRQKDSLVDLKLKKSTYIKYETPIYKVYRNPEPIFNTDFLKRF